MFGAFSREEHEDKSSRVLVVVVGGGGGGGAGGLAGWALGGSTIGREYNWAGVEFRCR